MPEKSPNYTEKMEAQLEEQYTADPTRATVEKLADELGKPVKSVIAKLSNMGIYRPPPRTSKNGDPIIKKDDMVKEISTHLGISIPSLVKTNKQDLKKLVTAIREKTNVGN